MIVAKKTFELPEFRTLSGRTIERVRIGWESYGELNAEKSNAILVCHYFSGASHAAGRYAESDPLPGYWDAIIGSGKAIDTDKYFVFSSDTLVNINAFDPTVVTTGPASINPATGKPYGLDFPLVTIGDFVRVQKALVDSLGIRKLRAVIGPSMGGLQTYEWAASYPDMMERIMPVIAAAKPGPWLIAWLNVWGTPVLVDPAWNGGDYYDKQPPTKGLAEAIKIIALHANHYQWTDATYGRAFAKEGVDPADAIGNKFRVEAAFEEAGKARAQFADANHLLYLIKANQTFIAGAGAGAKTAEEGLSRIKAPALALYSPTDLVFPSAWVEATIAALRKNGVRIEHAKLEGPNGHLNGLTAIGRQARRIAAFIDRDFSAGAPRRRRAAASDSGGDKRRRRS
ncbi:MAG TPA: homoserine O-acetyltransferase [Roseiarcus sp.]|nr:homoserine O-acetyltransferase [Roseiarcus sp.]